MRVKNFYFIKTNKINNMKQIINNMKKINKCNLLQSNIFFNYFISFDNHILNIDVIY